MVPFVISQSLVSARAVMVLGLFLAAISSSTPLLAETAATIATPAEVTPPDEAPAFLTARTVLWNGRSQVIPFRMKDGLPVEADLVFPGKAQDPSLVEILRPATVLEGQKLGFLRVRALRSGRTLLQVQRAEIAVEIRDDPAAALVTAARPRIIGPVNGAAVWGKFAVGVELLDAPQRPEVDEGRDQESDPPSITVQLRLPDGRLLDAIRATDANTGPIRRLTFEIDADQMLPGPLKLVAVAKNAGASATDAKQVDSDEVIVNVVRATPNSLIEGACVETVENPPALLDARTSTPTVLSAPGTGRFPIADAPFREVQGQILKMLIPTRRNRAGLPVPKTGPMAGAQSDRVILAYSGDRPWRMAFTAPEPGRYQLFLRARGDEAEGVLPTAAIYLNDSKDPAALGRLVSRDWHRLPLGTPFSVEAGPQEIDVQFKNDFYVGKEDRNLFLDRYELLRLPAANGEHEITKEDPASVSVSAPDGRLSVTLLYPRDGQDIFAADAVVARFTAPPDHPAAWADVLVDEQPLGLRIEKPAPGQPLVFPLPVRGLVGPSHHLRVRVVDDAGRIEDSLAQFVNFLAAAPPVPGPYQRALRLLNRFAYGPEPRELAAILTMGEQNWLRSRLETGLDDSAADRATLAHAIARYPRLDDGGQTIQRALFQAINSDNPVRTRFTFFIENHFNTWINKTKPAPKWHEHLAFLRLGIAPFADLLDASTRSPAMLVYLDQEKSYAHKLNENYAREIMELHTLGVHSGYTQSDVTTMAGLLTGWTLATEARLPLPGEEKMAANGGNEGGLDEDFRYDPLLNDGQARRVFGITFAAAPPADRYDRVRLALEFLAAHPATAEHICRQIVDHYVGTSAPDTLVQDLAGVYLESGGDMRSVLRALASHPLFWSAPARLTSPQDYALRLARLLRSNDPTPDGSKSVKPEEIEHFLKLSGMGLFDRATPDGYPAQDTAYADSNALLQRWREAQRLGGLISDLVPVAWRQPPPRSERSTLPEHAFDAAQRLIDLAALRLTGHLLSPASNEAARGLLGDAPTAQEIQQAIVFVSLLPEANLR